MILSFFVPSTRRGKSGKFLALPGRNELECVSRGNYNLAAKYKREEGRRVADIAAVAARKQGWHQPKGKVRISYLWIEPNDRRDQDNIRAYEKCLLDGLTPPKGGVNGGKKYGAGIIKDDSQKYIDGCTTSSIMVCNDQPGVYVRIEEVQYEY